MAEWETPKICDCPFFAWEKSIKRSLRCSNDGSEKNTTAGKQKMIPPPPPKTNKQFDFMTVRQVDDFPEYRFSGINLLSVLRRVKWTSYEWNHWFRCDLFIPPGCYSYQQPFQKGPVWNPEMVTSRLARNMWLQRGYLNISVENMHGILVRL